VTMTKGSDTIPEVFHLGQLKGHDVNEITVEQLQHLLSEASTERLTSVQYVKFCLDRIRTVHFSRPLKTAPDIAVHWADE